MLGRNQPLFFRTKHVENVFVFLVLLIPTFLSGSHLKNWVCLAAIYFSFKHVQISDRLREREEVKSEPSIDCAEWLTRFFMAKELLWVMFFILSGSYTALIGSFLFLLYPVWRRYYRSRYPLKT